MGLLNLLVARADRVVVPDDALAVLDEEGIDRVVTRDATTEDAVLVEFPLPTQAVEYVLEELRDAGLDDDRYTVITATETAKTAHFHELEDRFVAGPEEDDSVAPEEIRGKTLGMHRDALTYYGLTLLAAPVGFERDATRAVEDVLSTLQYDEVELIRVRADVGVGIGPDPADGASVTVVTTRPADTEYPDLATRLAGAIAAETGREVAVVVEFTDLSRAPPPSASDAGSSRGSALPRRGVDAGGEGIHPGTVIS